jgi:hypothetical protein
MILAAAALAVLAGALLLLPSAPEPAPAPVVVPEPEPAPPPPEPEPEPEPEPAPPPPEPEPLPALDVSDAFVRDGAAPLSNSAVLATLLRTDQLLRKLTAVVENLAQGQVLRAPVAGLAPRDAFPVRKEGLGDRAVLTLDPAGYDRFNAFGALFASLDPEATAALLKSFVPLMETAYGELGVGSPDVLVRVRQAIDVVLTTPRPEGPIRLKQPSVMYTFADPVLEALAPAQKLVLRMGPDNRRELESFLSRLKDALTPAAPEGADAGADMGY